MLVLSRRATQKLVLPELGISITVVAIKGGAIRVGIDAPPQVTVWREELRQRDGPSAPAPATRPDKQFVRA